ncbi:MAG: flavin reductase family protein [Mesorhizobium sp.]|nr:flavin reductase family protein [Mesorhizobium sp.]MBL8575588.1 flavin reductase family protein [Mesorhizobium sp.]
MHRADESNQEQLNVAYRTACGLYSTPVAAVTARVESELFGATVNSFTSLSLDPAMLVVCLAQASNTAKALQVGSQFGLSILSSDQETIARTLASRDPDKMKAVLLRDLDGLAPVVEGAQSQMACHVEDIVPHATHVIIIARLKAIEYDPTRLPAVYYKGRFVLRMSERHDGSPIPPELRHVETL